MEVRSETAVAFHDERDDVGRTVHRLERADAERYIRCQGSQCAEQLVKRRARYEIPAVGTEMNTGDRNFLESGGHRSCHSIDHTFNRNAAPASPRRRNDAVAAALLAARLNSQRERGSAGDTRLDRCAAWSGPPAKTLGCRQFAGQQLFVVIVNDAYDVRKSGHFVRPPRGITTCHDDARGGVVAGDTADRLSRALIGRSGDRARIDDDDVRLRRRRVRASRGSQLFLDAQRIRLIDSAAEGHD